MAGPPGIEPGTSASFAHLLPALAVGAMSLERDDNDDDEEHDENEFMLATGRYPSPYR